MSISLNVLSNNVWDVMSQTWDPIKIDINEEINERDELVKYGMNKFWKRDAHATIDLEFDAYPAASLISLREVLDNRKYETKVFINHPATYAVQDHASHSTGTNDIRWNKSDGAIGSLTEITAGNYTACSVINSSNYEITNSTTDYTYVDLRYDISAYLANHDVDDIDRLTICLHNPYSFGYVAAPYEVFACGYRVFCKNGNTYTPFGMQTYTIPDIVLRGASTINQRFFSLKQTPGFTNIHDYISSDLIEFVIVNDAPRVAGTVNYLGFNYAGLVINGYGCKRTNSDNFTFRNEYTGSGYTGSVTLTEI